MGNLAFTKVHTDDLEASATFYESVFGIKPLERITENGSFDEIIMGTGEPPGSVLILVKLLNGKSSTKDSSIIGFLTEDLEGRIASLIQHGGTVTLQPIDIGNGRKAAMTRDPEGQTIEIIGLPG